MLVLRIAYPSLGKRREVTTPKSSWAIAGRPAMRSELHPLNSSLEERKVVMRTKDQSSAVCTWLLMPYRSPAARSCRHPEKKGR